MKSVRIEGLIFSKLGRRARNTKELLEFADICQQHGADLISLAESIDTSRIGRVLGVNHPSGSNRVNAYHGALPAAERPVSEPETFDFQVFDEQHLHIALTICR